MIITGIYNLKSNPAWALLKLQEIYLECDTTLLNFLEVKAQWSQDNPNNNIYSESFTLSKTY